MRIYGLMVTHNEGSRYLADVVAHHAAFLDDLFVYDDQSTDDTADVARRAGAVVMTRSDQIPSFLEHEGVFRQAAWDSLDDVVKPAAGDWVFALDADEYFITETPDTRSQLEAAITAAEAHDGVRLRVDEVFAVRAGRPYRRVDGFWGEITAVRLARWKRQGEFRDQRMGGGSVPTYAIDDCVSQVSALYSILHFGYARAADRRERHQRYVDHPSNGHNPRHIASILTAPKLERLEVAL